MKICIRSPYYVHINQCYRKTLVNFYSFYKSGSMGIRSQSFSVIDLHVLFNSSITCVSLISEEEISPGAEKSGCHVRVPRADDETFQAFFAPALQQEVTMSADVEVDLDAIDSGSRQL